jgi:hypothetical protein
MDYAGGLRIVIADEISNIHTAMLFGKYIFEISQLQGSGLRVKGLLYSWRENWLNWRALHTTWSGQYRHWIPVAASTIVVAIVFNVFAVQHISLSPNLRLWMVVVNANVNDIASALDRDLWSRTQTFHSIVLQ